MISLVIVWNFVYFQDAYEEFQSNAITTSTRTRKIETFEFPAITICSNVGLKPSFSEQDNVDSHQVFLNSTYANDLEFWHKFKGSRTYLKPGENNIIYNGKYFGIIGLRLIPTRRGGTCHGIQFSNEGGPHTVDIIYKDSLSLRDIPKSFTIYFTAKNDWQAIIYNNNVVQKQPFNFDTSAHTLPIKGK